jgi:hypothetical protein
VPGQALRASCGQRRGPSTRCVIGHARRCQAAQAARTVRVGRSREFRPVDDFLIEILFYFIPNSFQIQTLKNHI